MASSPAINAGNNAAVADLTTDQRGPGYPRLVGTVDIGASEFGAGTAGLPLITRNASGQLVITFLRRKASTTPGVTYTPETGSLLTDFTALSLSGAALTSIDANWERVVVTDPSTATKRFGRVRVQAAP